MAGGGQRRGMANNGFIAVVYAEQRLTIPTGCPKMFADLMTDSWLTEPKVLAF